MPKVTYCPCCGYDFRNKNWAKESEKLLKRYSHDTYELVKKTIKVSAQYTEVTQKDVYKFLMGLSTVDEDSVFDGCKTFLHRQNYHTKGLNYAKYIILNTDKNKEKIISRLRKTIGGKSVELKDE